MDNTHDFIKKIPQDFTESVLEQMNATNDSVNIHHNLCSSIMTNEPAGKVDVSVFHPLRIVSDHPSALNLAQTKDNPGMNMA